MRITIIFVLLFLSFVSVFAQKKGKTSSVSIQENKIEIIFSNYKKQMCESYEYLKIGNEDFILIHYTLSTGIKINRTYPREQVKSIYLK